MGSMCPTSCLLISRFCVCSPDNTFFLNSSFELSIHLRFGLPFVFPTHTLTRLSFTHLFLISFRDMAVSSYTFLNISPTFVVPLILSILILSIFVIPHIYLNILISATSNLFSCAFFATQGSAPYSIAGQTTVLYTLVYLTFLYMLIFL